MITRRSFIGSSTTSLLGLIVSACTGRGATSTAAAPTTTVPLPATTMPPPANRWEALAELRRAMQNSPDHLIERARRLVEAGDQPGLLDLVRSITTYPAGRRSSSDLLNGRRWGHRATLRGGAGTPREKADLLVDLYRQTGWEARVVAVDHDIDQPALFTRNPKAQFAPDITSERLTIVRQVLGLPAEVTRPQPLDPGGVLSAALADEVIGVFETALEVFDPFEFSNNRQLPGVVVTLPDGEYLADLWTGGGIEKLSGRIPPGLDSSNLEPVEFVLGIVRSTDPSETTTVATWSLDPADLPGRYVTAKFLPAVNSVEELIAVRRRDVTTFVPSLVVRAVDLALEESQKLSFRGTPFTIGGATLDIDGTGPIRMDEAELGDGALDPTKVDRVRGVIVTDVQAGGFPEIRVEASLVDADGGPVEGLPAGAFAISEDGIPAGFILLRNRHPDPKILFLLDGSSSIPKEFLGEGVGTVVRAVAEGVAAADPSARFRVAMASFEDADPRGDWTTDIDDLYRQASTGFGYGSSLWEALISAASLGASTVVFITDADATINDSTPRTEVPLELAASVALGPPTVMLGVGPVNELQFDAFVTAGRAVGAKATQTQEAVDSVLIALAQSVPAPYAFTYRAPADGPDTRHPSINVGGVSGEGTYVVPPAELQVVPPSVIGLNLTIRHRGKEVTRTLAGVASGRNVGVTTALVAEVRSGLFGEYVLEFEAAAPPPSVLYDEVLAGMAANRSVAEASTREELLDAFKEGTFISVPPTARVLSIPLSDMGNPSLTYETDLRMILHHRREIPVGESSARIVTGFDILPFTSFTTAHDDPALAFSTTARRTARLALAEAQATTTSTYSLLDGVPLSTVGFSVFDLFDRPTAALFASALESWGDFRIHAAVPTQGNPVAAWALERSSGSMWGVLASGAGGGEEVAEINRTFDDARSALERMQFGSDVSSMLGMPGLSFGAGVWIQLELTKLEKLRAATLMLATMTPPEGDIADMGNLACSLARSAVGAAIGWAAGGILGEAAGELAGRIDSGISVGETATGGGFC